MKMTELQMLRLRLESLVLLRGVLADGVVAAFLPLLEAHPLPLLERVGRYADFAAALLERGGDWSGYLLERTLRDENRLVVLRGRGKEPSARERELLDQELAVLQAAGRVTPEAVAGELEIPVPLPGWAVNELDYRAAYRERLETLDKLGYGIFAGHAIFRLREGELEPVLHPDPIRQEELVGYEREREMVAANTRALLKGLPAANILLYGDSGTGKSTCVKAVANALSGEGLRLVELRKDQLHHLPRLIDRLSGNPLRFILFIDDLSFSGGGDHFSALKAVLEGSVSAKSANMAIYATSNRRHLVRETFSGREGDDVHLRDTLEELSSLSDRFGLQVTFLRPDRALYLGIVAKYCGRYGLVYSGDTATLAESFALRRGGRSARVARQFAQSLAAAPQPQERTGTP